MKPIDVAKALGVAALILAIDLACAFAAVWFWSLVIAPGHPTSYYVAGATPVATLSTRIVGPALFALMVWRFSRRRPERNPFLFAGTVWVLYLVLDGATVAFHGLYNLIVLVTIALKLAGALLGAGFARLQRESAG